MGHAASGGSRRDGISCLTEGGAGPRRQPSGVDYSDYLPQYAGAAPGRSSEPFGRGRSLMSESLEEPRVTPSCCSQLLAAGGEDLVNPASSKPLRTDACSLLGLRKEEDAVGCAEVCGAVCMTEPQACNADRGVREGRASLEVLGAGPAESEVLPDEPPGPLRVPPQFEGLLYDWSAPSEYQVPLSMRDQERLQYCLRSCARSLLAGVELQLRLDPEEVANAPGGYILEATLSLSKDLSLLTLAAGGVERGLPLRSVRWVRPPRSEEPQALGWLLPDERDHMVVLRMAGGRFVRFQLAHKEQAAFLGTCLRLLAKASRSPRGTDSAATADASPAAATAPALGGGVGRRRLVQVA